MIKTENTGFKSYSKYMLQIRFAQTGSELKTSLQILNSINKYF